MRHVASKVLASCVAAGLLVACGGPRGDVFAPPGQTTTGATRIDMLVATTRDPASEPGELFSGERGQRLSLAEVSISIPPAANRAVGEVQWPTSVPGDPERNFVVLGTRSLNTRAIFERLRTKLRGEAKGRVLVFVHGYNNRFADAVFRFAQIAHDSNAPSLPVLFTWPSRASALAYYYDRESANFSRDALELALRSLVAEPTVKEVDILAHSMGSWVTLEALRQIAIKDGRLPAKIKNVMTAAPDVDVDVFGTQIARMGNPRPRFTVFTSQDDRALSFSQRIGGGVPRLGLIDASKEPYRSQLAAQGVEVYDLTTLSAGDSYKHGKFAESPPVVQFIGQRLAAGQKLGDNGPSIGESVAHIATGAGNVAGLIVTSPLAILDPDSRRTFGGQISHALGNLERRQSSGGDPAGERQASANQPSAPVPARRRPTPRAPEAAASASR